MILDKELEMATGEALDLGPKTPGPGQPIKCVALKVAADVVITTGDTLGTESALMTVVCEGADLVEFELPSSTLQFIVPTFADGAVEIILPGAQTNT